MELGDWLRGLGLEPVWAAFRENAIDETPDLTVEDLTDPGAGRVGHRRKLFDAIAESLPPLPSSKTRVGCDAGGLAKCFANVINAGIPRRAMTVVYVIAAVPKRKAAPDLQTPNRR
jgi:hypothetical protein